MNLLQQRTLFRTLSGRFDLVNADFTDNGADFFINEGRKYLDRLDETQKSWASCFRIIEVNGYSASIVTCRAIKEVWAATSSEKWQLEKKNLQDLISSHLTVLPGERTSGSPAYYSPAVTRYIPEDAEIGTFEAFLGWVDIPIGPAHEYNTILLSIPVSEKTMLDVKGLFYSHELVNDTDTNYWSSQHPMLLHMAAMRYIEINNRNTQGVRDWEGSITTDMKQLGMDLVEELIAEVSQMGG